MEIWNGERVNKDSHGEGLGWGPDCRSVWPLGLMSAPSRPLAAWRPVYHWPAWDEGLKENSLVWFGFMCSSPIADLRRAIEGYPASGKV